MDLEVQEFKNMYWFSGLNNHNKESYYDYIKMYTVAVITAKETNPFIKPYLILDGTFDDKISKLINLGVTVIPHESSFKKEISEHYKNEFERNIAFGAFLRVDIPKICKTLNIEDDFILYTDNDVMFMSDVSDLKKLKPKYFLSSGEFVKSFNGYQINSGVMWINWKEMENSYDEFKNFIIGNFSKLSAFDQGAFRIFYGGRIEELNYNYNFKPYWGESSDIKILHFHGPKPTFNESQIKNFPYQNLFSKFYYDLKDKFNTIYDNNNLFNT
jgi:lipopolysaccharide biosynthesis glycosyltransferase